MLAPGSEIQARERGEVRAEGEGDCTPVGGET